MVIRVSPPEALAELMEVLSRSDCAVARLGPDSCTAVHVHETSPRDVRAAMTFFLAAWCDARPCTHATIVEHARARARPRSAPRS